MGTLQQASRAAGHFRLSPSLLPPEIHQ